ncbi:MAG: trypsin-like peptidase domain-containing protein [Isosphaeraceae bacterium]
MARVVICPSCLSKGSVPDNAAAARIRCPKCGHAFDVSAATGPATSQSQSQMRNPAAPKRPKPTASAYQDPGAVEAPLPAALQSSGARRSVPQPAASQGMNQTHLIYALLAVGGAAVALLSVLIVVLLRGAGSADRPADRPRADVAETVAPVAPTPPATVEARVPAAPSSDSPENIRRIIKEATIYLKNKIGDKTISSGTGFVIEVRGDSVLLATNRHVAVPDISDLPERIAPQGSVPTIEAVFRSGQRQQEQSLVAHIAAADLSEELNTDLAFLVVEGVNRPPQPINPLVRFEPSEGVPYICAGFPLGGMIGKVTETHGNPSVTITGGRISALRRDDHGQLNVIQVDGSLQPGNSGGPIIDEKTGKLIGVAVAKVSSVDTIGFVVPAEEVRRCLAGRVGAIQLKRLDTSQTTALEVKAQLVDPKRLVQSVVVHVAPAAGASALAPDSAGNWPALPNTSPVELQKDDKTLTASGKVQVALGGQDEAGRKILIQTAHRNGAGQLVYSKPKEIVLPEKAGPVVTSGSLMRTLTQVRRKSFSLLGPLIDPDKDCKLVKDADSAKLKIEIPGKLHTLSPHVVTRRNKKLPLHNAPMTLAEVEGDFAAIVEVTGDISPGTSTPKDRQGNMLPFTYQGGGLIVYQDKDNFFRLERAASVIIDGLQPVHRLLIEAVKDGKEAEGGYIYLDVPEKNTLLIVIRRKGRVRCLFSPDGGNSVATFKEFELDLPPKVKVGLTASNISAKPFTANFENFAIVNDATKIDSEFGG